MSAALPDGMLVAWYGDDFTGSAATMEVLEFAGIPSVLFNDIPTEKQLARFPEARAIGIASTARSHGPEWMDRHIPSAFAFLAGTGAPVLHYKTCSTLDSAPRVGSIGRALELASGVSREPAIPFLLAAPAMRRYQVFGHLFASAPEGVFRIDRHPVMSRHPVTPMDDSDVRRHLSRQTGMKMGLISLEDLRTDAPGAFDRELQAGARIISLDTVGENDLAACGALIWERRGDGLLAGGSQGVEYALVEHWRRAGALPRHDRTESAGAIDRMVAVSGSVSPTTAAQIDWAERNGFRVIPIDAAALARGEASVEEDAIAAPRVAITEGEDPLVCSARGPNDPAVASLREAISRGGLSKEETNSAIGAALGRILRRLLEETSVRRAVISGGDTSGHASRQLDIFAFTALAPTIPGAALLTAHSERTAFDGLQIALKGGQMGSADYFGWIKRGGGTG